jgi:Cation transporting ATPase, C-terminus
MKRPKKTSWYGGLAMPRRTTWLIPPCCKKPIFKSASLKAWVAFLPFLLFWGKMAFGRHNCWVSGQIGTTLSSMKSSIHMDKNGLVSDFLKNWAENSCLSFVFSKNYRQRKVLEQTGQSAYFLAIVFIQWMNVLTCRSRRYSIFKYGMK